MAQKFQIKYFDDLDGTDLGETSNTISFAFEGKEYAIDLSDDNAEAFREAVAPYIQAGHRVTGSKAKTARKTAAPSGHTKAIREWARNNGYDVSDRGRSRRIRSCQLARQQCARLSDSRPFLSCSSKNLHGR